MERRVTAVLLAVSLGCVGLAHATSNTVSGRVERYGDVPGAPQAPVGAGREVKAEYWKLVSTPFTDADYQYYYDPTCDRFNPPPNCNDLCICEGVVVCTCYDCAEEAAGTWTTSTDANGDYSLTFTTDENQPDIVQCTSERALDGVCDELNPGKCKNTSGRPGHRIVISTPGSETEPYSESGGLAEMVPPGGTWDFSNAPHYVSPNGAFWARRLGTGEYPVFDFEGFDPSDRFKSGCEACPDPAMCADRDQHEELYFDGCTGRKEILQWTPLETQSLYDYALNNDYTLWLLLSGERAGDSIRGTEALNYTDGLAYQVAYLAERIRELEHPGRAMVAGGYSMGGLLARTALTRWCQGAWVSESGGVLEAGCENLALWWSGDAPLEGARIPTSLQYYVGDNAVGENMDESQLAALKADSAREMILQYVVPTGAGGGDCDTDCVDVGGCSSTDSDFTRDCYVSTAEHDAFTAWMDSAGRGGFPARAGTYVPAVAFSVGKEPGTGGTCYSGQEYMKTIMGGIFDWVGDHDLYINTANGTGECAEGSVNNSLGRLGLWADGETIFGIDWEVWLYFHPTYIPTKSALAWDDSTDSPHEVWKDYWFNTENAYHANPFPQGAAKFLMAWTEEYLKGDQYKPSCDYADPGAELGLGEMGICGDIAEQVCGDGECYSPENCDNCAEDCGICVCVEPDGQYISHFTGPNCTGDENYFRPYHDGLNACAPADSEGALCGTELLTQTHFSYRQYGHCYNEWPEGKTLPGFVRVHRGGCGAGGFEECGNGECNGMETCETCPADCSSCCVDAEGVGASSFTGPDCTGEEYFDFLSAWSPLPLTPLTIYTPCRPDDYVGAVCGTEYHTDTVWSKRMDGVCTTYSEGRQEIGLARVYRDGCVAEPAAYCGDGSCNGLEMCATCPDDCGGPCCGNGTCDFFESVLDCPTDCPGFQVGEHIEAEWGRITPPMQVESSPYDTWVVTPVGTAESSEAAAEYEVWIETAGNYYIWTRVRADDAWHDSFYVEVLEPDGDPVSFGGSYTKALFRFDEAEPPVTYGAFGWTLVHHWWNLTDPEYNYVPTVYYLGPGVYTIRFTVRDLGTELEALRVDPFPFACSGADLDNDGWTTCEGDCWDKKATVNPGVSENCLTSYDDDCDGSINEGCNGDDDDDKQNRPANQAMD